MGVHGIGLKCVDTPAQCLNTKVSLAFGSNPEGNPEACRYVCSCVSMFVREYVRESARECIKYYRCMFTDCLQAVHSTRTDSQALVSAHAYTQPDIHSHSHTPAGIITMEGGHA